MKIFNAADFYNGDIGEHSDVQKYEDCANLCVANADCSYFTFSDLRKKCYLKGLDIKNHRKNVYIN